jgi:hypothetical protein
MGNGSSATYATVFFLFTFVLPIESGERTSFAVTLFLTFVVVMTVVSETLPATDKMGYFSIFKKLQNKIIIKY